VSGASPAFSRGGALALIAVGFALFLGLIWLIAEGAEFGPRRANGAAHAASKGLNGYAGLVRLLEAEGYAVNRSRSPAGLETEDLLVLTPPAFVDAEEFAEILKKREALGPTLVILPKWSAGPPPPFAPREVQAKFKPDWVVLDGANRTEWTADLPAPYGFAHLKEELAADEAPAWDGLGLAGRLPTRTILYTEDGPLHEPLVTDAAGHTLALKVVGKEGTPYFEEAHWTIFVTEPDLMNNYGLADKTRAAAALALVEEVTYGGDIEGVTFDLTQHGYGASENLLTLAFRPPFLAATLCLLLALLIIGWRAFQRFGPPAAAAGPAIAFGKQRLIANGAGLILRARRLRLLPGAYVALTARRLADQLSLARPDPQLIDAALALRLPQEEPFTHRAARLEAAHKPADILAAAKALDDLTAKL
jgi:hypothetical protein